MNEQQKQNLDSLFNQVNDRLAIIGETPDAYLMMQLVEILKFELTKNEVKPDGEPAKLPAWRGICHPDGTRHLTQNICMNAHQLRNALDFVNPDGAKDTDQLESDLTIQWRKEAMFEGENYPAGLYAHFSEYPEEGSILLDAEKSAITHPAPTT